MGESSKSLLCGKIPGDLGKIVERASCALSLRARRPRPLSQHPRPALPPPSSRPPAALVPLSRRPRPAPRRPRPALPPPSSRSPAALVPLPSFRYPQPALPPPSSRSPAALIPLSRSLALPCYAANVVALPSRLDRQRRQCRAGHDRLHGGAQLVPQHSRDRHGHLPAGHPRLPEDERHADPVQVPCPQHHHVDVHRSGEARAPIHPPLTRSHARSPLCARARTWHRIDADNHLRQRRLLPQPVGQPPCAHQLHLRNGPSSSPPAQVLATTTLGSR